MTYFAGLDVSVKETSVCVVDDAGKIVREARVITARRLKAGSSICSQQYVLSRLRTQSRTWSMGSSFNHRGRSNWLRLMTALVRYRIRLVAELNHRIRGFDAGRQERRQEHERAFGRLAVRHHRSDGQRPERRDLIGARPRHRWIIYLVARRCELQHHLESDRSMSNALANLVFEIVGRRLGESSFDKKCRPASGIS